MSQCWLYLSLDINLIELVARLGFEPRSAGPKPAMMDPYTIGLCSLADANYFLFLSEEFNQIINEESSELLIFDNALCLNSDKSSPCFDS